VISILKTVDLAGKDGIVSEFSPGVFLQVYLFPFVISSFSILLIFIKASPYLEVECVQQWVISLVRDMLALLLRELLLLIFLIWKFLCSKVFLLAYLFKYFVRNILDLH
jgi:hypothetical protein